MLKERSGRDGTGLYNSEGSGFGFADKSINKILTMKDSLDRFSLYSTAVGLAATYGGVMFQNTEVVVGSAAVACVGMATAITTHMLFRRYVQKISIE